jgi:hypothetical protein
VSSSLSAPLPLRLPAPPLTALFLLLPT